MFFSPAFKELRLVPRQIYLAMGYHNEKPDAYTTEITLSLLQEATQHVHPRIYVEISEGVTDSHTLIIGNAIFHPGPTILQQFKSANRYYTFIETAGQEYEDWKSEPEKAADPLQQYILDSLGTCIIEGCTRYLLRWITRQIPQGWGKTLPLSPGHCEWATHEQQQLFALFSSQPLPVSLTDSCLMLPIKSASGIIGIGENIPKTPVPCQLCNKTDCFRRMI